jgi:hypothetical protein
VGRNQLIDSGMPPAEPTTGVHSQHGQLAKAENLTTLSILMACFRRILQIRETNFTS